jgi:hypothetical protein
MNLQLLQRAALVAWLAILALCLLIVGRQLLTQFAGRTVTGKVIASNVWMPPYADWPHYDCIVADGTHRYKIPNATIPSASLECRVGENVTIKIDPLSTGRAQLDSDILDNGSALAWYFLVLSIIFGLAGLGLRVVRHVAPWRTALSWLFDRIQGNKRS